MVSRCVAVDPTRSYYSVANGIPVNVSATRTYQYRPVQRKLYDRHMYCQRYCLYGEKGWKMGNQYRFLLLERKDEKYGEFLYKMRNPFGRWKMSKV